MVEGSATIAAASPLAPAPSTASARRQRMLEGPIVSTMLGLAAPTIVVLVVQTLVGVAETYFVSFLGTGCIMPLA